MKSGILVCEGTADGKNIGDYVQSLAARQFAGDDAVPVERESLDTRSGERVRVVMNAWFMHNPDRFPPSDAVEPLFVSFHLRPEIESAFFTPATVAYLKAHEPIGCRDLSTVEMMRRHGIAAEFTSCVTLTLGETFRRETPSGAPVFVDPYFNRLPRKLAFANFRKMLGRVPFVLRNFRIVSALAKKCVVFGYWPHNARFWARWYHASELYRAYSPVFADAVLANAEFVTHKVSRGGADAAEMERRAADLLLRYARAPFVVTSRLHCALPCIAIGVPVVVPYPDRTARGRFDGNAELMNVVNRDAGGRLVRPDWLKSADGRIGSAADVPAREDFRPFADAIARRCRAFFGKKEL